MKLLVSLCNNTAMPSPRVTTRAWRRLVRHRRATFGTWAVLCEYDLDADRLRPIRLQHNNLYSDVYGATGITTHHDDIYVLAHGRGNQLLRMGRDYRVSDVWSLMQVWDGHSMVYRDDAMFIASSGNNRVMRFDPDEGESIHWSNNGEERKDTIHLNSLIWHDGKLLASAFGYKRDSQLWSGARQGYVVNVGDNEQIKTGLDHPHSLMAHEGEYYVCESRQRRIRSFSDEMLEIPGAYVRGLAFTDRYMLVGCSKRRTVSKSTGNAMPAEALEHNVCAVHVYERGERLTDAKLLNTVSLERYGNEIYDICVLGGD